MLTTYAPHQGDSPSACSAINWSNFCSLSCIQLPCQPAELVKQASRILSGEPEVTQPLVTATFASQPPAHSPCSQVQPHGSCTACDALLPKAVSLQDQLTAVSLICPVTALGV